MRCSNRDSCTVTDLKSRDNWFAKQKSGDEKTQKKNSDATSAFSPPHRAKTRDYPPQRDVEKWTMQCSGRDSTTVTPSTVQESRFVSQLSISSFWNWEIIRQVQIEKLSAIYVFEKLSATRFWAIIRQPEKLSAISEFQKPADFAEFLSHIAGFPARLSAIAICRPSIRALSRAIDNYVADNALSDYYFYRRNLRCVKCAFYFA